MKPSCIIPVDQSVMSPQFLSVAAASRPQQEKIIIKICIRRRRGGTLFNRPRQPPLDAAGCHRRTPPLRIAAAALPAPARPGAAPNRSRNEGRGLGAGIRGRGRDRRTVAPLVARSVAVAVVAVFLYARARRLRRQLEGPRRPDFSPPSDVDRPATTALCLSVQKRARLLLQYPQHLTPTSSVHIF